MKKLLDALRSVPHCSYEAALIDDEIRVLVAPEKQEAASQALSFDLVSYTGRLLVPKAGQDAYGHHLKVEGVSDEDLTLCPLCGQAMFFGQVSSDGGDYVCRDHGRSLT
jgi:hypothetical protein